ncbi:MAG TPA: LysR family transcriptional regulator [Bacillus sp. (in: firmicutes)]|uniref:LysR family transcriptional regulator n=1 Tax=Bacillus litorisediminis TaxID=2922713 RepID=UPI001FAFD469|nr:LysR family transcriptional regulator [Bacillus litorisediminis]HWO76122.1 LysR family transcriptional regulator [Bacillus sp. (in: firmicutes)]
MRSQDWEIVKLLFKHKNITKTAQSLYISQPALTNRIKQIEKEFGIQMVNRGRRGVHFTPQGEYLAKCADEVLKKLQEIKENLANMDNDVVGTLKLGVSSFFTKYKLPRILRLFKNQYPNVEFQVMTGWSRDMLNALYKKDVHIAFVRGDYHWQGPQQFLFEEHLCIASIKDIKVEELPYLPRINYKTDHLLKALVDNWWSENFSKPPMVTMEVDQIDTCKEMVANGLGYAIVPSMTLKGMDEIYKIKLCDKNGEPIVRKTWMFYHDESLDLNVVKAFVSFVETLDIQ